MPFQVSPGINISELDLTAGTSAVSVSDAAFAGPFQWGPALQSVNIGSEDELVSVFGKPDDTIAAHWFSAAAFLAYSNLLHVVRAVGTGSLNATVAAKTLTGTVSCNASGNAYVFTAAGGLDPSVSLVAGQKVTVGNTTYTVNTTNTTAFTTTTAAAANVSANAIAAYGVLVKNDTDYDANFSAGVSGYGSFVGKFAGEMGNALKVAVCASANAFYNANTTGSVSLTAGSKTVTGTNTKFDTECVVGDYITVDGRSYQIDTIASNVSMTLETAAISTAIASAGGWTRKWEYADLFDRAPGSSPFVSARLGADDEMHLVVVDNTGKFTGTPGTVLERFAFVSKAVDSKDSNGEGNYYVTAVTRKSNYVRWLAHPTSNTTNWGKEAAGITFGVSALPVSYNFVGGQTDNVNIVSNDGALETAYDLFKNADEIDVSLIISGPASAVLAGYLIQNIAEVRQDCVVFVSPLKTNVVSNTNKEATDITTFRNLLPSSSYGFFDSGWKYTYDKYNDKYRWIPLNGDMAGIAARCDTTADPWFSPAGFSRGNVKNVVKLAYNPKQADRDALYKIGVNPVVTFPGQGTLLYGDKTLLSRPSAFDRINVRRLFIIVEKTIARYARTQLFEFNDEATRSAFRNVIEPYLRDVKARRGLVDYRVVCDESNNTTEVIETNRFVGDIYLKPAHSINFIQLNFVAVRSGVSFQEVTGA